MRATYQQVDCTWLAVSAMTLVLSLETADVSVCASMVLCVCMCSVESAVELRRFSHVASCDQSGEYTLYLVTVLIAFTWS